MAAEKESGFHLHGAESRHDPRHGDSAGHAALHRIGVTCLLGIVLLSATPPSRLGRERGTEGVVYSNGITEVPVIGGQPALPGGLGPPRGLLPLLGVCFASVSPQP